MKEGFIREIYLNATPSVDLALITEEKSVDCTKHTIPCSVYDRIVAEYAETEDDKMAAFMFMLQSGPQLVRD